MDIEALYDLLVIGGGINGAGIARDAAGRNLRVMLVEQDDLAQHTSSASTKLLHGGLRYLEYYEFRLVREALRERERLLRMAPHIIWPLCFVLPHGRHLRPAWLLRLGLFLYDHLGGRQTLPGSRSVHFHDNPLGSALKSDITRGFAYSDCWVEDSRLVVLNAMDAAARGGDIRTRTRLVEAVREANCWRAVLEDQATGLRETVIARVIVNAGGPWVEQVLTKRLGIAGGKHVRLIKGSHIIVPKLFTGEHAYILQNDDRRIVFAIPYEQRFTLIGTTDIPWAGDPGSPVVINADETQYLCDSVNRYFAKAIGPADVVWSYAGLRPLYDDAASDASAVTRDYVLDINAPAKAAPLLSVFGGKITTYRRLAEHAMEKLASYFPHMGKPWTDGASLPGGDILNGDFEGFVEELHRTRPFLPRALARRLARAYGTRVATLLGAARTMADLGEDFGGGLTQAEVDYLRRAEWALTPDDILWRRSKLGLHVPEETATRLAEYLSPAEKPS